MKFNVLLPILALSVGIADATCKYQDVGVFKQKWRLSTYKSENCINKAYDVTKSGWGTHCVNFPNNVRSFIFTVGGGYVGVDAGCTIFFNTKDNCGGSVVGRSKSHWIKSSLSAKGKTMKSAYVQCTKLLKREEGAEENEKVYIRGDDDEWYEKISDTEVVRAPELGEEEGERVVRRLVDIGAGVEERDIEAEEDVEWTAEPNTKVEEVEQIAKRDVEEEEVEEIADRGIYADEVEEIAERDVESEEVEEIEERDAEAEEVEIEERDAEAEEVEEIAKRDVESEEVEEIEERDAEAEEVEIEERDAEAEEVEEIAKRDVESEEVEEIEERDAEAEEVEIEERDAEAEEVEEIAERDVESEVEEVPESVVELDDLE